MESALARCLEDAVLRAAIDGASAALESALRAEPRGAAEDVDR